jgi:hypothetical protein
LCYNIDKYHKGKNIMPAKKQSNGCPIAEAVAEIEKMNQNLDKQLEKDYARCSKQLESAKKKLKKLADTKVKAAAKKKAVAAKIKTKPTAANKTQLEKANAALLKANSAITQLKEEISAIGHVTKKCARFIKRRKAEAKLLEKFRKDQAKKDTAKLKKKSKPSKKRKVVKKSTSAVENNEKK